LHKQVRSANTLESLDKLSAAGFLGTEDARFLKQTFEFLRTVEKILRRQNELARTRLPDDERALMALSRVMGFESTEVFMSHLTHVMAQTRDVFIRLIGKVS
jgi:glutamine synthetase adenylyltransferase